MHLLVIEDDPGIAATIRSALEQAGYLVEFESNGENGWFRGDTESFDAIILDLGLPTLDGLTILKRWRKAGRKMPVLVLTARGNWDERVEGIDAGADDYMAKPFRVEELVARIRALLRRAVGHPSPVIEIGEISLDTRQMRVTKSGRPGGPQPAGIPARQLPDAPARAGCRPARADRAPLPAGFRTRIRTPSRSSCGGCVRSWAPTPSPPVAASATRWAGLPSESAVAQAPPAAGFRHLDRRCAAGCRTCDRVHVLPARRAQPEVDLESQLARLVALIDPDPPAPRLTQPMSDPRYETPAGGIYWQIRDPADGTVTRSRSLWDTVLQFDTPLPEDGTIRTATSRRSGCR